MTEQPSERPNTGKPQKQPYGPGLLMVFGLGLVVAAIYIVYALYSLGEAEAWREQGEEWKIPANWAAAVVALGIAVYLFALAAKRAKGRAAGGATGGPASPQVPETPVVPEPPDAGEAPTDESPDDTEP